MASSLGTSVQHIETTASSPLPLNYQQFRKRHMVPEWHRTESMYQTVDETEGTERLKKMRECRKFAYFARHSDDGKIRVISNSCRMRWCPICAEVRSHQISEQIHAWLCKVKRPKFLTLTYAHSSKPLSEQIKGLYKHFRLFRQRVLISNAWRGGIWFFQVKRSKETGEWHPHLHCIIDGKYIPQKELSLEWLYCTESSYIIDIRSIKAEKTIADYVARYCARPTKLTDLDEDDSIELFNALHRRRLCGTFGTGKRCSLRPPRVPNANKWQKVGNWLTIVMRSTDLHRARVVIEAFRQDGSVDKFFTVAQDMDLYTEQPHPDKCFYGIEDFSGKALEYL